MALKTQIDNQPRANRIAHARHGLKRNRRFWTNNRNVGFDDMARVRMGNRHAELLARKAGWIGALTLAYGIQPGIRHITARTQMAPEQLEHVIAATKLAIAKRQRLAKQRRIHHKASCHSPPAPQRSHAPARSHAAIPKQPATHMRPGCYISYGRGGGTRTHNPFGRRF